MLNRPTYRINPIDTGQKRGIGISVLFNNDNNIFNTTTTTKEQVKANLINYILTDKGERFFDPTFGGNLRASLFEPDSNFDSISARLEAEIIAYIPNIVVKNIFVKKSSDENIVNIVLEYSVSNQDDNLVINVSTNDLSKQ
jgi:phage baseplate assembly protein W